MEEGKLKQQLLDIVTKKEQEQSKYEENKGIECKNLFPLFLPLVKQELILLAENYKWTSLNGILLDLTKLFNINFKNANEYSFKNKVKLFIEIEKYLIDIEKLKVNNIVKEENIKLIIKIR